MHDRSARPSAAAIRSQFVLEIAAGYAAAPGQRVRQATALLRDPTSGDPPLALSAASTYAGIDAVVAGEATLAMMNPSAGLTLAYRGTGRYAAPQPVRVLTVIPSFDRCVFAFTRRSGIATFEQVVRERRPVRLAVRGQRDHYLHEQLAHVLAAAGCATDDLTAWGGSLHYAGSGPPRPGDEKFALLERDELDGLFDEGIGGWLDAALQRDMTIPSLAEPTLAALEARGYRRGVIARAGYPRLPADVTSIDFSGWPAFVHANAPDEVVTAMCRALVERKALIPWEGGGPLPVERMWRDAPDTPRDVPLHPAAERFWRALAEETERG